MKLLAVGDLHLGRTPSRLPADIEPPIQNYGPAEAWRRVVKYAQDQNVDIVALAGDVVERENDFFEAYGVLVDGVSRLAGEGITVVAVAGNHDVKVLPQLAQEVSGFDLLGQGQWEAKTFESRDGSEKLTLHAWSFQDSLATRSPLSGQSFEREAAGVHVGLLHCDRDQPGSRYAPVSSAELNAAGLDGWLLGHIHRPDELRVESPSGYLGSVTALDASETGPRGPWLIEIRRGRIAAFEQLLIAPLRWELVDVDLTGAEEPASARSLLLEKLRALDREISEAAVPPMAAGLRASFVGRTRHGQAAAALISESDRAHIYTGDKNTHYFVERLQLRTLPEIPLHQLAERADPAGLLARQLLVLDRNADDGEKHELLSQARRRLEHRSRDPRWNALAPHEFDDAAVADYLRSAGTTLLGKLLEQQGVEA